MIKFSQSKNRGFVDSYILTHRARCALKRKFPACQNPPIKILHRRKSQKHEYTSLLALEEQNYKYRLKLQLLHTKLFSESFTISLQVNLLDKHLNQL